MYKYFISILILLLAFVATKITKKLINRINKDKKLYLIFLKSAIQALIVIFALFVAGSQFSLFREISGTLVASSTLVVAVVGFSLEEGITNIIHGLIISISKPFNVGDRLNITSRGITGIVESITLRHTVLRNVLTNTCVLVPNSIIDKEIIENNRYNVGNYSFYVDVTISRDADIEKAMEIMSDIVKNNSLHVKEETPYVWVNALTDTGILLRVWIVTETVDKSFIACSEVRTAIAIRFKEVGITPPKIMVNDKFIAE